MQEVGYLNKANRYLLELEGLPSVSVNSIIEGPDNQKAWVTSLSQNTVTALQLTGSPARPGDEFKLQPEGLQVVLGEELLGRVIGPLGNPLDGKASSAQRSRLEIEAPAKGIDKREVVSEQLTTGITIVDTLLPVGKGQRELIFGEPRTGKSSFMLNVIQNQKDTEVICVYAALGKEEIELRRITEQLSELGAIDHTVVVAAGSGLGAPAVILAPSVAMGIAENFASKGKDVVVFLDDLGVHAKYLREVALLSGRVPGRESYPGDIFYQHAQIVERAGNFNAQAGGGSITLFPVIEAHLENITGLIPTNVMSATDGHLLFTTEVQTELGYPAVDIEGSVTRVGRQTQNALQQEVAQNVRASLAEHADLEKFSRFDTELSAETKLRLQRGSLIKTLLHQELNTALAPGVQLLLMTLPYTSFTDNWPPQRVKEQRECLVEQLEGLVDEIGEMEEQGFVEVKEFLERKVGEISGQCQ